MSTPESIPKMPPAIPTRNPFVGPRPMEKGDALFGRDAEIEQLYYLLSAERIVLLHSPSGAGKSSLVQAGLIPRLASHFDHWGPVRVNLQPLPGTTPEINRFTRSCILGFESELPERLRRPEAEIASLTLARYLASRTSNLRRRNAPENTVLLFDQFEEILTADPLALEARTAFFTQLGTLLQEDPHLWALFILREDYLAPLDPYANLLPTHLKTRFRLDLFTRTSAAESIQKSIESAARTIDPIALYSLVSDLAMMQVQQPDGSFLSEPGPYVEPLHLQVACRNLWDRLPPTQTLIQSQDLDSFGGVTQALSDFYATEVQRVAATSPKPQLTERNIRDWIGSRLITSGDIRTQVLREQSRSGNLENRLIERLVQTHLIRAEQRAGATWYELSHDRLIRPVRASNVLWFDENLSTLQKTATLWSNQGESPGLLFTGDALIQAQTWAAAYADSLEDVERAFLRESVEKQATLDREKRYVRRLRIFVVYAIISALVAIGFMLAATIKGAQARAAEEQAYLSTVKTEAGTPGHGGIALAYLSRLLRSNPESGPTLAWTSSLFTQQLWWLPSVVLDKQSISVAELSADAKTVITVSLSGDVGFWDAGTGASLAPSASLGAARSYDMERSPDVRHVLIVAGPKAVLWDLTSYQPVCTLSVPSGMISLERFSFDGSRFVTTSSDGLARVWDAADCSLIGQPHGHPSQDRGIPSVAISGDGRRIVSSFAGDSQVWDVATNSPIGKVVSSSSAPLLNADGTQLLLVNGIQAQLLNVDTGQSTTFSGDDIPDHVSFGGKDEYVLINASNKVSIWGLPARKMIRSITLESSAHDSQVSDDGSRVASFTDANSVYVWSTKNGTLLGDPLLHGNALVNYRFSPDGNRVMTSSDHAAQIWASEDARSEFSRQLTQPVRIRDLQRTSAGTRLLVLAGDGTLQTLDQDGRQIGSPILPQKQFGERGSAANRASPDTHTAKLVADGTRILVSSDTGLTQLWDTDGKPVGKPLAPGIALGDLHSSSIVVRSLAGSPSSDVSRIHVFDASTGGETNSFPVLSRTEEVVQISPDDRYLVTGTQDSLQVRDLKSGALIKSIPCAESLLRGSVSFSPDGKRLALANGTRVLTVASATGQATGKEISLRDQVMSITFSPDGRRLIIGTERNIQIWDTSTAQLLGDTIRPASLNQLIIRVSPDGQSIVTVSGNTVELWDASTGRSLRPAATLDIRLPSNMVEFSSDGHSLLIGRYGIGPVISLRLFLGAGSISDGLLLAELAEVAGGYHFNSTTGSVALIEPRERADRLLALRSKYQVPPDQDVFPFLIHRLSTSQDSKRK